MLHDISIFFNPLSFFKNLIFYFSVLLNFSKVRQRNRWKTPPDLFLSTLESCIRWLLLQTWKNKTFLNAHEKSLDFIINWKHYWNDETNSFHRDLINEAILFITFPFLSSLATIKLVESTHISRLKKNTSSLWTSYVFHNCTVKARQEVQNIIGLTKVGVVKCKRLSDCHRA